MVEYLKATQDRKRSAATDRFRIRALRRHFAEMEMNALEPQDIRNYADVRRKQGVSDTTINRDLALLLDFAGTTLQIKRVSRRSS